jgi:glycosyltransferase involved in cell wall biosynthesis
MPLKILVLTSSYPTREGTHEGGFVADLVRRLPERGVLPVVLAPHFPGGRFKECRDGVLIFRFPYFFPLRFERLAYGAGFLFNIRRDFFAFVGILPFCLMEFLWTLMILFRERVDLIHSHWLIPQGLAGAFIHRITGIPHVVSVHGSDLALIRKSMLLTRICSFIIRQSDAVTVNSRYTRQQLVTLVPGSEQKIRIIPMGVDLESFYQHTTVTEMNRLRPERIILNVGRLIELKGTRFLIEAMPLVVRAVPGAMLVIIGTGPEEEYLVKRVRELCLDDHVQFLGTIRHDELAPYYQDADVFVLSSITIAGTTEGLGVVLLEAMASGCPVIGTDTGGIPDIIIDGENGFLVPEQRPDIIAERIVRIVADTELQEKFRRNGLKRVRDSFSWERISDDFSRVFDQVHERYKICDE